MEKTIKIAVADRRTNKKYKNIETTWEALKERCKATIRTTETVVEYPKMTKVDQDSAKDHGGFVGGHLREGVRKNGNVLFREIGLLDADHISGEVDFIGKVRTKMPDTAWFIYSTHRHRPEQPRFRLAFLFSRQVTEDEYPAVMRKIADSIGMDFFDDSTYQANRMMYWPSSPSDGEFIFEETEGKPLDPDFYLALYSDWKDASTWPISSRQSEIILRSIKKQSDPLCKDGLVGAFCRTYGMEETIDKFLSDIYEESLVSGRYNYLPADSTAGVVVYEDKFAFSHHSTDPASGRLLNAFDLVRIHRFEELDNQISQDIQADRKPSFKAMMEFVQNDPGVKVQIAKERKVRAELEFENEEWEEHLEFDKKGRVENTLRNITLIMQNDPKLKSIVFNQLSDGIEIKGSVPWKHPARFWRDQDDAQLICYIDAHYGSFSARNYDLAVAKVTDDRAYHPIREFIDTLPKWDGVARMETILIEFLGARDNEYVRAVTRKTLCAAITRVLTPGIKFDTMLVLNGPQGVGKSTLISRLAGEWFSDSLLLSDTKDKTAAEKLQGYWILEIGELAGLNKAAEETLRSFLSRQNDIYRAAFGKRATPHHRQCVFFGTTNAEKGYLRDTTGNRRFWPVKTPGTGVRESWQISQEEVKQIWAETLHYVLEGEELHLDKGLEALAKEEQREAMESDEREGLVRDFLEMLLPEDWSTMDTFERRAYVNGNEFGGVARTGINKRAYVSNMEIWCECFGKDRANLKRSDGNEISSIMAGIAGWSGLVKKERTPLYGPQWIYVNKDQR